MRTCKTVTLFAAIAMLLVPACATMQQVVALRSVTFAFTSVSDVRLAGIPIGPGSSYSSLGLAAAARLGAAVVAKQVPIELVAHVGATNPAQNKVVARMVGMGWALYIGDRQALVGDLVDAIAIAPGRTTDVPLSVRFDLLQVASGGAHDLFDLAMAIAGQGTLKKDVRLELKPTVNTSLGPIRYPAPIVVRRTAG